MLQRDVEFAEDSFIIVDGYSKWEGARRERERLGSSYAKNCYSSSNSTIKMIISTSHSLKTKGCSCCHYSEKIYLKKRKEKHLDASLLLAPKLINRRGKL